MPLLPLLAAVLGASCHPKVTELFVTIDTDLDVPDELTNVHIVAGTSDNPKLLDELVAVFDKVDFPLSIGLIPGADKNLPIRVVVTGRFGTVVKVTRSVSTSFVEGKNLVLPMDLRRDCLGSAASCTQPGKTCREGVCVSEAIEPATLRAYGEDPPKDAAALDGPVRDGASSDRATSAPWYDGAWGYRKAITVHASRVPTGPGASLAEFPLLVQANNPDLRSVANGGKVQQMDGFDLVFTKDDGVSALTYELEGYDRQTGTVLAWVKMPVLPLGGVDTTIYLYFGNALSTDPSNKTAVWNTAFKGVWHFSPSAMPAADSTGNANKGTLENGATTALMGKIHGAATFMGGPNNDYVSVPGNAGLGLGTTDFTISFWMKTAAPTSDILAMGKEATPGCCGIYNLRLLNGNSIRLELADGMGATHKATNLMMGITPSDGAWHHVAFAVKRNSATGMQGYFDGTLKQTADNTVLGTNSIYDMSTKLGIGTAWFNTSLTGSLDEVRISNTVRSADWIATEYDNQNLPLTFCTAGALESR